MNANTPNHDKDAILRLVFWETTTSCNLKCIHCRASAAECRSPEELTTDQSYALLREIASFAKPVIVLSGGEPLVRDDIFDIASYGSSLGLRMVLATNGTTLDAKIVNKLKESGIQRISVSIDGADAERHDSFRGVAGAFESALNGIHCANVEGLPVQINTTIARHNYHQIQQIYDLAISLNACALHLFLLVPTGCGKEITDTEMIAPDQYENVLNWIYDTSKTSSINLKATCAPHYFRVIRQRAKAEGIKITPDIHGLEAMTKGCLAGSAVCFVSYKGDVYPCGYFPVSAGNVITTPMRDIWTQSELFRQLRDHSLLEGKCGICEYARVCSGCRARAYGETGNYLGEEPYCIYLPKRPES